MIENIGNLGEVFAEHRKSDATAIIDLLTKESPREISYNSLSRSCDAVARGLVSHGLGPGDRVGILALNRVEFLEVLFGAMRVGCIPVMINVKLPAEQVRFIVADAAAKIVFGDGDLRELCEEKTAYISFDNESYIDFQDYGSFEVFKPGPKDVAEQPYTSGSTGRPKGVLLHHWGQRWMIDQLVKTRGLTSGDCGIISAPLYHKNALLAIKSALQAGGRIVLQPKFDVEQYIKAIEKHRVTMLTGVPTMYALMLQQEQLLDKTDLSSVRNMSMGSAPLLRLYWTTFKHVSQMLKLT